MTLRMSVRRGVVVRYVVVLCAALALSAVAGTAVPALAAPSFTLFESGQVRPLALSPDGKLLFAVNTPDNRLEVFQVKNSGLTHRTSIPVGLEPVAVAARSDSEVWVVNHLSDSVSAVQITSGGHTGYVQRTLLVGDEPRDIVFAGPGKNRAFITTAHRGQNAPFDPQLTTPSVGRADVWSFDATNLGASLGGDPLAIITLFCDTPRAMAVSPDGMKVYAAAFQSGNQTTVLTEPLIPNGFGANGVPGPATNFQGVPAPEVGLIVQWNGANWVDEIHRAWDTFVLFSLPDKDVFVIDAMANPPVQVPGPTGFFTGVGTVLFNMAVNPVTGKVYVSNTEARNLASFEGPGIFAGHSVRGHLHESRITVLSPGTVTPIHLNKHINYGSCCAPVPNAESVKSLAQPQSMAVTSNGATLYVAALGSSKIGVFNTAALEADTFVPNAADHITVSGGGPTGLVLDEPGDRLYVLTRFDNAISIINTLTKTEIAHLPLYNPEPPSIVQGRRFLYDAAFTSSHGDSSCASCHVFADFDSLGWNLGNPDAPVLTNPGPFFGPLINLLNGQPLVPEFHPMKGPMVTQSLRGMANHGPMHWRGDRTGGNDAPSAQSDSGTFDERAAFKKFQVGFTDLLGRHAPIPAADMEAFTDFILQVTYPPNPIRNLDNSLTPDQQAGQNRYFGAVVDITGNCNTCHKLDPNGNPSTDAPGFFGTEGRAGFDFEPQLFKAPHLRNAYQKVGMFGRAPTPALPPGDNDHKGDQTRGFGFIHDGSFDTPFRFFRTFGFSNVLPSNPTGFPYTPAGDVLRRQVEAFVFAFPSNLAPIVGQQITLNDSNNAVVTPRIALLKARADAGECDLIAKTALLGTEVGFFYIGAGKFMSDRQYLPAIPDALLQLLVATTHSPLTYTCTSPGSGVRLGIDHDEDGYLDGDERDAGSDPVDPTSTP